MRERRTNLSLRARMGWSAVVAFLVAVLILAVSGWVLYRSAARGCIRGFRGGCDPAASFPRPR